MNTRSFEFGGVPLELVVGHEVFEPNLTTRLIAESIDIPPDARVLDLGCGIGPIAIIAAKKGAREVYAVDVMEQACAHAQRNVELNGVTDKVQIRHSNLFTDLAGERFDVIIDDVSGMAEGVSRISPWYPDAIPTGNADGSEPTIQMLREARDHLNPGGTLYFPLLSLAAHERILDHAHDLYGRDQVELVAQKWVPFCKEFKQNMDAMEQMKTDGLIDYTSKRSRYLWSLAIYRVCA